MGDKNEADVKHEERGRATEPEANRAAASRGHGGDVPVGEVRREETGGQAATDREPADLFVVDAQGATRD